MISEKLTDACRHDPDNFCYLIYGIINYDENGFSKDNLKKKLEIVNDIGNFYRASLIAKLNEDVAREKLYYFGALNQTGTFGKLGLILNPINDASIYVAWNCDLGSPNEAKELEIFAINNKGKIKNPLVLLTTTIGPDDIKYNELILRGDKKTEIQGIFYKEYDSKIKYHADMFADIASESLKKKIPIIKLPIKHLDSYEQYKNTKEKELAKRLEYMNYEIKAYQSIAEFKGYSRKNIMEEGK